MSMRNTTDERVHDAALVVFARLPVEGRVKTRLAATIGHNRACAFYKQCAEHILQVASSCEPDVRVCVYHSHGDDTAQVHQWVQRSCSKALEVHCQDPSPDLGDKMMNAMACTLAAAAPCPKVLIIGSDIPDITPDIILTASRALDKHEMVVGPALDGGFYLLGLTAVEPTLFQGVQWSTDTVLEDVLRRAVALGWTPAPRDTLPTLRDIDTVQDLDDWAAKPTGLGAGAGALASVTHASSCSTPAHNRPPGSYHQRLHALHVLAESLCTSWKSQALQ